MQGLYERYLLIELINIIIVFAICDDTTVAHCSCCTSVWDPTQSRTESPKL